MNESSGEFSQQPPTHETVPQPAHPDQKKSRLTRFWEIVGLAPRHPVNEVALQEQFRREQGFDTPDPGKPLEPLPEDTSDQRVIDASRGIPNS